MTDLAMGHAPWLSSEFGAFDRWDRPGDTGRHAFDEDAVLTPIFHALKRGRRDRRHEVVGRAENPVDDFHRDPLTAPIPVQAMTVAHAPSWRRSGSRRPLTEGRHRLS